MATVDAPAGAGEASPSRRSVLGRWGWPGLRILVSGAGLAVVIHSVDLGAAVHEMADASPALFVFAVAAAVAWQLVGFVQWCVLLPQLATFRRGWLARLFLRSTFLSLVIPSGIGGDALRAREVGAYLGYGRVTATLAASRILTALSVAMWSLVGSFFLIDLLGDRGPIAALLALVALTIAGVVVIQVDRVWRRRPSWRRLSRFRDELLAELASYRRRLSLIVPTFGLALAAWGLNIASTALFAVAIDAHVSWQLIAIALPVSAGITLVPVTVNGLGIREGALIAILVQGGVPVTTATALTVFIDVQLLPLALLGAAAWLTRYRRSPERSGGEALEHVPPSPARDSAGANPYMVPEATPAPSTPPARS